MVETVMDFEQTVKTVEGMKKNAEANVAFANQLKANIVALQNSVKQDVTSYSNKTCHHLTANQKRARAIKMAKEFVEEKLVEATLANKNIKYETMSDSEKRKVKVVLKYPTGKQKGKAKCRKGEVFNEYIGEAIALAKALDIVEQLPPDILKAVQPDACVKGMKIVWIDYEGRIINEREVEQLKGTRVYFTNESWMPKGEVSIIDDTNADYALQGGEK